MNKLTKGQMSDLEKLWAGTFDPKRGLKDWELAAIATGTLGFRVSSGNIKGLRVRKNPDTIKHRNRKKRDAVETAPAPAPAPAALDLSAGLVRDIIADIVELKRWRAMIDEARKPKLVQANLPLPPEKKNPRKKRANET